MTGWDAPTLVSLVLILAMLYFGLFGTSHLWDRFYLKARYSTMGKQGAKRKHKDHNSF